MRKGYQVLVYDPDNKYWAGGWVVINNSFSFPYEYKGFALNRAKGIKHHWGHHHTIYVKVVECQSGEVVWKCYDCKEVEDNA
jgi:hypothetical protein